MFIGYKINKARHKSNYFFQTLLPSGAKSNAQVEDTAEIENDDNTNQLQEDDTETEFINDNLQSTSTPTTSTCFEELLINEIREYPLLWNPGLRSYKENPKKNVAWKAIAQKLGQDGKLSIHFF